MINTKELRLGNFINYDGDEVEVLALSRNAIKFQNENIEGFEMFPTENYNYIELSHEWLLKLGFSIDGNEYTFETERYIFKMMFYDAWNVYFKEKVEFIGDQINLSGFWNVHELQNLFFALTGEELPQVSEGKK